MRNLLYETADCANTPQVYRILGDWLCVEEGYYKGRAIFLKTMLAVELENAYDENGTYDDYFNVVVSGANGAKRVAEDFTRDSASALKEWIIRSTQEWD